MKESKTNGIGFAELLQIAFIVLKLCGVIEWSWIWVMSPTWVCLVLVVAIVVIYRWVSK